MYTNSYDLIKNKNKNDNNILIDDSTFQSKTFGNNTDQYKSIAMQFHKKLTRKYKVLFLSLVISVIISLFYWSYWINTKTTNGIFYNIVFDAGSTGTRIHVFKIKHDKHANTNDFDAELVKEELVIKVKPGLSAYHLYPDKVIN